MARRTIVLFCMSQRGHLQRMRPLISMLAASGWAAHVFTDRQFKGDVEASAGRFQDLFAPGSLAAADEVSMPPPFRYVTFAGRFAHDVAARVRRLRPAIVASDSFAIVGHVVARRLGVPHVNICAGHNVHPGRLPELLPSVPATSPSPACLDAARRLSDELEIALGDPFSYLCVPSRFLNVYCEPPEFLTPAARQAFEPIAFFGSVDAAGREREAGGDRAFPEGPRGALRVYVSLGTVSWRYWPAEVEATLGSLAEALGAIGDARALLSLGGHADLDDRLASNLARPNVRVTQYVDQWRALKQADVFVTHHGLNSTHEAIYHRVPMLSCPILWDQSALARRCQELGVALPLMDAPRAALMPERLGAALGRLRADREELDRRLGVARGWEERVIAARAEVIRRIEALA
jgi:UDP:flavonoid glycosyltransferase YjiC (YdhE family)